MLSLKNVSLLGTLVASIALSGCETGQATVTEKADTALPIPVETTYPSRESISATYETSATITTDMDAPSTAKVPGEVVEIRVEEGAMVQAGEILAVLDGERLRLEMLNAKAELDRLGRDYDRNTNLHQRGLISASSYEGLKFDQDAAKARYELAALKYDDSNIRAPIAGVVASRDIKLGQTMQIGDTAFRITNTSKLLSYLKVPQSELNKFAPGNIVKLTVASLPQTEFVAEVGRVSPTIDKSNGTFRVTAFIDNTVGLLAPGMFARFSIAYEEHSDALTIPSVAIVEEDGENVVYVVKKNEVIRRTVETGIVEGSVTEILSGLAINESVVIVGQSSLTDGTRVLAMVDADNRFTG